MREKTDQDTAEKRIASRYKKLHIPIVELVQALQDAIPSEVTLGEKVVFKQMNGYIEVATTLKPRTLVLEDGQRKFTLIIEEISPSSVIGDR